MPQQHCLFVLGSLTLTLATFACGISFFAPYWLYNVHNPPADKASKEADLIGADSYIISSNQTLFKYRGLWAQCSDVCQFFWEHNFKLQLSKFIDLGWHLAAQVLYLVAFLLILLTEVISRLQLCCRTRMCVYRLLGFTLLVSFVLQAAAVAVFGGFGNKEYGAGAIENEYTHFGWAFWLALVGAPLTLLSGAYFLFLDCCNYIDDDDLFK